jgi:hypothetical protein
MIESTVASAGNAASGTAAAGTAAKAGLGTKMLAIATSAPAIGILTLAGIIAYEFWKGSRDAAQMQTA